MKGGLKTRQAFGDCQLHVEFASPREVKGNPCAAYGAGYVCLTASGNCVMGDCATNGDCNGKICASSNHTCTACTTATDCSAATAYGTGYVCQTSSGTCG